VRGEVVGEGTRVLVLASEVDEAFCAGADLKERRGMSGDEYVSIISIFLVLEYLWCSSFIYLWVV